ncbi:MAG: YkgJ family cysteine cluster protein [Deltaproteobacteria bacterium]|nr:YkgJ family cysteine cluster protein [Deltaproteobacteria bacterium]
MENKEDLARINPVQLDGKSKLQFKCHKGLNCFTKCCRGINIMLTPYDIIRLKNRLQLTSEQFLAIYTKPELLEKTDLPVVTLKLLDDEEESCPFVKDEGCIIYEDRPTACRYYPAGVATLSNKEEHKDGFYFLINEPHCEGFKEDNIQTITEWRKDQGVDIHDEINEGWTELLVKKRSFPKNIKLTDQSKKMFFMISYNIDEFKEFVFNSSFLKRYAIEDAVIEEIKKDEKALLQFGIRWLSHILFNKDKKENSEFKTASA